MLSRPAQVPIRGGSARCSTPRTASTIPSRLGTSVLDHAQQFPAAATAITAVNCTAPPPVTAVTTPPRRPPTPPSAAPPPGTGGTAAHSRRPHPPRCPRRRRPRAVGTPSRAGGRHEDRQDDREIAALELHERPRTRGNPGRARTCRLERPAPKRGASEGWRSACGPRRMASRAPRASRSASCGPGRRALAPWPASTSSTCAICAWLSDLELGQHERSTLRLRQLAQVGHQLAQILATLDLRGEALRRPMRSDGDSRSSGRQRSARGPESPRGGRITQAPRAQERQAAVARDREEPGLEVELGGVGFR